MNGMNRFIDLSVGNFVLVNGAGSGMPVMNAKPICIFHIYMNVRAAGDVLAR